MGFLVKSSGWYYFAAELPTFAAGWSNFSLTGIFPFNICAIKHLGQLGGVIVKIGRVVKKPPDRTGG